MRILQLLPELKVGGVERGTVDLSDHLVKLGHDSAVISAGGQLVNLLSAHGAKHYELPIAKKNIRALSQINNLKKSDRLSSYRYKLGLLNKKFK